MAKAKITTTSKNSADVEPFELRSGTNTRLVFKPTLVNNNKDKAKPVRGKLLWQRLNKSSEDDEWEDESTYKLTKMEAGTGLKLDLSTDELFLLTQIVRGLYGVFWENDHSLPKDGEVFDLADYAKLAKMLDSFDNSAELMKLTGEKGFTQLLKILGDGEKSKEVIQTLSKIDISNLSELNSLAGIGLLSQALERWKENENNQDEKFWQNELIQYSFVISQVFSSPVIMVNNEAYLGGKNIKNKGGKNTDFLFKKSLTSHVLIVEVKTPVSELLSNKEYRKGVYPPSSELSGVVAQIASQRRSLSLRFNDLRTETEDSTGDILRYAEPNCLAIIGNTNEFDSEAKRNSFELFRRGLNHTDIITYDELFQKIEVLLNLLEGKEVSDIKDS